MSDYEWEPRHHRYRVSTTLLFATFICLLFLVVLVLFILRYLRRQATANQTVTGPTATAQVSRLELPKTGLDPAIIAALPVSAYRSDGMECCVCLSVLADGVAARVLPNCNHAFHKECIDEWLHDHSSFPVCRSEAKPLLAIWAEKAPAASKPPSAPPPPHAESSNQRLSSFRKMLSTRERHMSSRSVQLSGQEEAGSIIDLEKQ